MSSLYVIPSSPGQVGCGARTADVELESAVAELDCGTEDEEDVTSVVEDCKEDSVELAILELSKAVFATELLLEDVAPAGIDVVGLGPRTEASTAALTLGSRDLLVYS